MVYGALAPETPTSDVDEIKQRLSNIEDGLASLDSRLTGQANGINSIGENLQWLISNVQGLFQMLNNPNFMSQMSNMLMSNLGGIQNAGRPEAAGPAEGPGGTGSGAG